jgi:hypothetical protein
VGNRTDDNHAVTVSGNIRYIHSGTNTLTELFLAHVEILHAKGKANAPRCGWNVDERTGDFTFSIPKEINPHGR